MIGRAEIDCIVNPVGDVRAVARKEAGDVNVAFLQSLVGVEGGEGAFELAMRGAVAAHLRTVETRAQAFELMINLAASRFESIRERRVNALQLLLQFVQLSID